MRKVSILFAMLIISMAGQAQRSIDLNLVKKAMRQQQGITARNDIAPIKATYQTVNGSSITKYRDDFAYDEYEYFLTQKTTRVQNGASWNYYMVTNIEVDYNNNPIEEITQKYTGDYWLNDTRVTMTYDEVGFIPFLKEEIFEKWEESDWVKQHKYIYDYDPVVTIIVKDWNGNTWENHYLYTIEGTANETTVLLQYWLGGAWQNQEKSVFVYNALGNEQTITFMEWSNATWVNAEQHSYEYDSQDHLSKITKKGWENGNWSSTNFQTLNYTSDGMGNSLNAYCRANGSVSSNTDITMYFNHGESIDYEDIQEISMEYSDLSSVSEHAANQYSVYPNPTENSIEILGEQFLKAEVYNLEGQKLMESWNRSLDLKPLSSGAYLLRIHNTDGTIETQKVLVK